MFNIWQNELINYKGIYYLYDYLLVDNGQQGQ